MKTEKGKMMNLHVINDNTEKTAGRNFLGVYLAFDFDPKNKRKPMIGFLIRNKATALALAQDFKDMAKALK